MSVADLLDDGLGILQSPNRYVAQAFHAIDDALISVAEEKQLPPAFCFLPSEIEQGVRVLIDEYHALVCMTRAVSVRDAVRIQERANTIARRIHDLLAPLREDGGE